MRDGQGRLVFVSFPFESGFVPLDFLSSSDTLRILFAPVAQLDRASDYGSEGCVFESRRVQALDQQDLGLRNVPENKSL